MSKFPGVRRRFSLVGEAAGISVLDSSYAHHPAEIAADLAAADALAGNHRVIVVFQPTGHRHTAVFGREIGAALAEGADEIILLDIHGDRPINGVNSTIVENAIAAVGAAAHIPAQGGIPALVTILAEPGDIVVTMGAGDVTNLADKILTRLRAGQPGHVQSGR
jgi:UDP-N-acetylmuramate--alanine ligase